MKSTLEISFTTTEPSQLSAVNNSQETSHMMFLADDVVLLDYARDEQEWLSIAQACSNAGAKLLIPSIVEDARKLADYICQNRVTVIITTAGLWREVYRHLNLNPEPIIRLKVVLTDDTHNLEQRYALAPRALSAAKIADTYEAYRKAPWL
ncbi:MAG: hypothetical protein ACFB15_23270 [Cyclobacteriaceae bacterium]